MAVTNFADKTISTGDNQDILLDMNLEYIDLTYTFAHTRATPSHRAAMRLASVA